MSGSVIAPCALAISSQQLSVFRDGALSAAAAARLRAHCATCPACQAQLAAYDAVGRQVCAQQYAGPDGRLWRGVHRRIAAKEQTSLMPKKTILWSGASVAAILIVLAAIIFTQFGRRLTVAQVTSTITPYPAGAVLTPEQAWGDHFATTLTVNIGLHLDDVLPDGSGALGDTALPGKPTSIVLIQFQTGQVHTLYTTPYGLPENGRIAVKTDGRYVAWAQNDTAFDGKNRSSTSLAYLDRQTDAIQHIPAILKDYPLLDALDHGVLIWQRYGSAPEAGIYATDLASDQTTKITVKQASTNIDYAAFAWPNLVIADTVHVDQAYLYNIQTDAVTVLQVMPNRQISTLDGNTLYWGTTAIVHAQTAAVLTEYDRIGLPGASPRGQQIIARSDDRTQFTSGEPMQANDRLIAWESEWNESLTLNIWDRAQQREIQIVNCVNCPLNFFGFTPAFIRGDTLVYATQETGKVTFYITVTSTLPR